MNVCSNNNVSRQKRNRYTHFEYDFFSEKQLFILVHFLKGFWNDINSLLLLFNDVKPGKRCSRMYALTFFLFIILIFSHSEHLQILIYDCGKEMHKCKIIETLEKISSCERQKKTATICGKCWMHSAENVKINIKTNEQPLPLQTIHIVSEYLWRRQCALPKFYLYSIFKSNRFIEAIDEKLTWIISIIMFAVWDFNLR